VGSKKAERPVKKAATAIAKKMTPAPEKAKAKPSAKASKPASAAPPSSEREREDADLDDDDAAPSAAANANGKTKEQLISLGKSKGFLTYDDVHEALPGEDVGPDQMDDVLSALDDEEIEVVDDASNIKIAPHRGEMDEPASKTPRSY
jgi:RNA polymerase primary sigma factor